MQASVNGKAMFKDGVISLTCLTVFFPKSRVVADHSLASTLCELQFERHYMGTTEECCAGFLLLDDCDDV